MSETDRRNGELLEKIRAVHEESDGTYGAPRVHQTLKGTDSEAGLNRIARLMSENGIRSKIVKSFRKPESTDSRHRQPVFPNLLPDWTLEKPNQIWVADITYLRVEEEWGYLAAVLDLYSRRVVGWALGSSPDTELTLAALRNALEVRGAPELHHSDRGCQYAAEAYRSELKRFNIQGSMSRKGNCYDNATMESFFGTLKTEKIFHERYSDLDELRRALFQYIEMFYNTKRIHSSLGFVSPAALEEGFAA